jgi:hypothetical protein
VNDIGFYEKRLWFGNLVCIETMRLLDEAKLKKAIDRDIIHQVIQDVLDPVGTDGEDSRGKGYSVE